MKLKLELGSGRIRKELGMGGMQTHTDAEPGQGATESAKKSVKQKQTETKSTPKKKPAASLVRNSPDAVVTLDKNNYIISCNPQFERIFQYSSAEVIGKKFAALIQSSETTPKKTTFQLKPFVTGEKPTTIACKRKDGSLFQAECLLLSMDDTEDAKGGYGVISCRAEEPAGLLDTETQKNAILDAMSAIALYLTTEREIVWANKAAAKDTGKTMQALVGAKCCEIWNPKNKSCPDCAAVQALKSGKSEESIFISNNGDTWNTRGEPVFDSSGKLVGVVLVARDITARTLAEKALKESEERYRTVLEANPDPVVILDNKEQVVYFNPAFSEVFGWSLDESLGKPIARFVLEENQFETRMMADMVASGVSFTGIETRCRTKRGQIIPVSVSGAVYRSPEGEPKGSVVNLRDIARHKELEAQLLQAQKMEAIGTLAGGIAHDFNNLLMGIQGRTSLMMRRSDISHPDYEHLKGVEDYVKSASDLTKQLLGFARGGKYEVRPCNLNEVIGKSTDMFGRTKKEITITKKLQENIWIVDADWAQIDQVLLNLYVNAWQAMAGAGEMSIETKNEILSADFTKPYGRAPGNYVRISVTDTGIGIDPAIQQKIFEPFFTTKSMGRGTGLGLASAYGIVGSHNGIINLTSQMGKGATFNVYLPVTAEQMVTAGPGVENEILNGTGTVLLVDDEEMIIEVSLEILEAMGYTVLSALNGPQAIETFKKDPQQIVMVILDMVMPGMGGGEVYGQMKKIDPAVKVLLSSGYSFNSKAKNILAQGCNGFIQKPFNIEDLSKKMREVLAQD